MQTQTCAPAPVILYPTLNHIPTQMLEQLPKSAILVYKELIRIYHWTKNKSNGHTNVYPSYAWLAAQTGYTVRTIYTAVHKLAALNLIHHIHRRAKESFRYLTNLYYIPTECFAFFRNLYKKGVLNNIHRKETASLVVKLPNKDYKEATPTGAGVALSKEKDNKDTISTYSTPADWQKLINERIDNTKITN